MSKLAEFKSTGPQWITVLDTEFYPDYLDQANVIYGPVIERFIELVSESKDSNTLLRNISSEKQPIRTQLQRVFRKYVSPNTSVEMLKRISSTEDIIKNFGKGFRLLNQVKIKLKKDLYLTRRLWPC